MYQSDWEMHHWIERIKDLARAENCFEKTRDLKYRDQADLIYEELEGLGLKYGLPADWFILVKIGRAYLRKETLPQR